MGLEALRERLAELTRQILDGDESAETMAEFDTLGLQYQAHPERDL
jgi:hypothetical protein